MQLFLKMLKYYIFILLNLFLLSELTVSMIYVQSDSPGIPCNITYAEKLFKKIFGRFLPEPPKNLEEEDKFNEAKGKFRAIFPGTLWCGDGDIANHTEDLGYFQDIDACCRAHDKCDIKLYAKQKHFGLCNVGLFTRQHCSCDEEFHTCLKEANSTLSLGIGKTYFNILRPQCFKKDYPATCIQTELSFNGARCLKYKIDQNKDKIWQWRDPMIFPA